MIKKQYKKPTMRFLKAQLHKQLLTISNLDTRGLSGGGDSDDNELEYNKNGGNQDEAW